MFSRGVNQAVVALCHSAQAAHVDMLWFRPLSRRGRDSRGGCVSQAVRRNHESNGKQTRKVIGIFEIVSTGQGFDYCASLTHINQQLPCLAFDLCIERRHTVSSTRKPGGIVIFPGDEKLGPTHRYRGLNFSPRRWGSRYKELEEFNNRALRDHSSAWPYIWVSHVFRVA